MPPVGEVEVESAAPPSAPAVTEVESSPDVATGDDGQGASDQDQSGRPPTQEDIKKLKASLQRVHDRKVSELRKQLASVEADRAALLADLDQSRFRQSLPNPTVDPEGYAKRVQGYLQRKQAHERTVAYIDGQLESFEADTGIRLTKKDPRLNLRGGPQAFLASLEQIRKEGTQQVEAKTLEEREKELRKQIEQEVAGKLGVDRYDGAGTSAPSKRSFTAAEVRKMSWQEYEANKDTIKQLARAGRIKLE